MFYLRLNIYILYSFLFVDTCLSAPEPMCSKFSYDEQLLEKMVRLEFNVQNMEKNMLETEKRIRETERNSLETLKNVTNVLEEIDDKLKQLELKEANVMNRINNALTERRRQSVVAFHAQEVEDRSLQNNQVIVFTKVNMNEGAGYDSSNGYFTAPVSGIFCFTTHLCGGNNKDLQYIIVVNDKTWASGLFTSDGYGRCTSVSVTVRMRSGERAWVSIDDGGSSSKEVLYEDGDDWNYFSGVLIHEID